MASPTFWIITIGVAQALLMDVTAVTEAVAVAMASKDEDVGSGVWPGLGPSAGGRYKVHTFRPLMFTLHE